MNYSNLTKLFFVLNEIDFKDLSEIDNDSKDRILKMIEALQEEVEGVLLPDSKEPDSGQVVSVKHLDHD